MINAKKTLDADDDEALTLQQFNYLKKSFFFNLPLFTVVSPCLLLQYKYYKFTPRIILNFEHNNQQEQ
jgi:hypothetical protein